MDSYLIQGYNHKIEVKFDSGKNLHIIIGAMALFQLQKMFSFRYVFKKKDWCIRFIFYTQVHNHKI